MAPTLRQQQILSHLQVHGKAAISELAAHLEVSDETIRRDIRGLSANGLVEKFHGGVRFSTPRTEPPFERRLREAVEVKTAIARRAASYIREGAAVLLDNSSSACFLARELVHREPMTILTISLEIAQIFWSDDNRHRVILPGGEMRPSDRTLCGAGTIEFLKQFTPSYFVMSVVAGSPRGCFDFDLFEAEFKREMIPRADETILLLDSSKFEKSGLVHVCDWSQIDVLVSDQVPAEIVSEAEHCHLLLVPQEPDKS
ncbi:DeoR family transcriptional regulator [Breoghania corrubedonensis]|uniref:DeoR family transcriptional regulator n=1 Tax=Breoghania corrubedonensis TaxID=665038 RepID=A0A2T5US76_9HYPH|nr:DeoR/GlpR family DNA-binding transcription regulator [Breoghania corrubedonensis]PTW54343.1 DeoR family transcriptional regulator [Breoghania corrubedonensis]